MAKISLTDFVDFVSKAGSPKLTHVKQIKKRAPYHPATDYWKILRDGIVDLHKNGKRKKDLELILHEVRDKSRQKNYPLVINSYKKFLGRKNITWFSPVNDTWTIDDLEISLNPEVGLDINGQKHLIKLYFKAEKLSQAKADLILLLMQEKLRANVSNDINLSLLDIQRNRLYEKTKLVSTDFSLLEAEALAFMTMWESI